MKLVKRYVSFYETKLKNVSERQKVSIDEVKYSDKSKIIGLVAISMLRDMSNLIKISDVSEPKKLYNIYLEIEKRWRIFKNRISIKMKKEEKEYIKNVKFIDIVKSINKNYYEKMKTIYDEFGGRQCM